MSMTTPRQGETSDGNAAPGAPPAPAKPHAPPAPCRDHQVPHGAWARLKELFRRFNRDECPVYAAALSFFSVLSLVPLLVVALAAMAFIFDSPHEALVRLQKVVAAILPG